MFHAIVRTTKLICLLGICLNPIMASGAMYKWVNEDGVTQYSQMPPFGVKAERIGPASKPANDPEALKKNQNEKMKAFDERRQTEKKQQALKKKEQQDKAKLKERCVKMQINIDTLKYKNRVFDKKDGEVVTLTTEQREVRLKEAQEAYNKNCK